jgi:hypothetical protein
MILTGSSNYGHSVCCKPDNFQNPCLSNDELICGPPSMVEKGYDGKYSDIMTPDKNNENHLRNPLMYAFCPALKPKNCGFNDTKTKIYATSDLMFVSADNIKYQEGPPGTRRHDVCFYEINTDIDELNSEYEARGRRVQEREESDEEDMEEEEEDSKGEVVGASDANKLDQTKILTVRVTKGKGVDVYIF